MGSVFCEMNRKFELWSKDAQPLLEGIAMSTDPSVLHMDNVWESLINWNETDVMTQEILRLLFSSFSITTHRLLLDHLPGGKHHSVTDMSVIEEVASVPTTNLAPERDLAILDRLVREKPNASVVALESMILYSHNKTSSWLEKQPLDDRKKLIEVARKLAPSVRKKFNERHQAIEERRADALLKRQEDITRRKMRATQENDKLTQEIQSIGLWMNRGDIERGLQNISKKAEKLRL